MATNQNQPMARGSRYVGETKEMLAAFQMYVSMGNKRSISAVAEKIGKPEKTVNNWSQRFEWRLRLQQIQEEAVEAGKEEIKQKYFEDAAKLRIYKYDLLEMLKAKIAAEHNCPECNGHRATVSEIISVFNVVKTELGEPTSIAKGTFTEDKPNPFAGIFNSFFTKPNDNAAGNA